MSLIKQVWDSVTKGQAKDIENGKTFVRVDSVEQGYNILAEAEKQHASGKFVAQTEISTAIESDLVKFLNYAVSLIPEKYALHKMLLVLRVNPIKLNPSTGSGIYLSKKYIAQSLTETLKRVIREDMIDKLEKESIKICQDCIRKTRETKLPILQ